MHVTRPCQGLQEQARTLNMRLCAMLKSAPITPAMTETATMKGSCSNHSLLSSSATPLKDSTPYFHLRHISREACHDALLLLYTTLFLPYTADREVPDRAHIMSYGLLSQYPRSLAWDAAEPG